MNPMLNKTIRVLCASMMSLAIMLPGACHAQGDKTVNIKFDNAFFYKDGKFDLEKGRDAIIALMKHHGYPVYPGIREKLFVSDYGLGHFTEVGLAAVMWKNNEADRDLQARWLLGRKIMALKPDFPFSAFSEPPADNDL